MDEDTVEKIEIQCEVCRKNPAVDVLVDDIDGISYILMVCEECKGRKSK